MEVCLNQLSDGLENGINAIANTEQLTETAKKRFEKTSFLKTKREAIKYNAIYIINGRQRENPLVIICFVVIQVSFADRVKNSWS